MYKILISLTALIAFGMLWSLWHRYDLFFAGLAISYVALWAGALVLPQQEEPAARHQRTRNLHLDHEAPDA